MIPWVLLDSAKTPDGGELRLLQRGDEFSIRAGTAELMNSRQHGSEEALARLACERIGNRSRAQILIGGLGMGFTLAATLAALKPDARVTVAELVPAVVAWARGPLATLFGGSLEDPRVDIRVEDVGRTLKAARASYDAILLDVDNGPEALTQDSNDALYELAGLSIAKSALRPGGVLAVWSSHPDRDFTGRLRLAGFAVEEKRTRAREGKGARHTIWLATNENSPRPNRSRNWKR
ncbi:hypothetical protein [Terrarubrum flagellatum]|uniref:spermidine synthase n=1 Tax=Terrirubrum flagellatum TaxID=2895980 RepID=UPI0031451BCB